MFNKKMWNRFPKAVALILASAIALGNGNTVSYADDAAIIAESSTDTAKKENSVSEQNQKEIAKDNVISNNEAPVADNSKDAGDVQGDLGKDAGKAESSKDDKNATDKATYEKNSGGDAKDSEEADPKSADGKDDGEISKDETLEDEPEDEAEDDNEDDELETIEFNIGDLKDEPIDEKAILESKAISPGNLIIKDTDKDNDSSKYGDGLYFGHSYTVSLKDSLKEDIKNEYKISEDSEKSNLVDGSIEITYSATIQGHEDKSLSDYGITLSKNNNDTATIAISNTPTACILNLIAKIEWKYNANGQENTAEASSANCLISVVADKVKPKISNVKISKNAEKMDDEGVYYSDNTATVSIDVTDEAPSSGIDNVYILLQKYPETDTSKDATGTEDSNVNDDSTKEIEPESQKKDSDEWASDGNVDNQSDDNNTIEAEMPKGEGNSYSYNFDSGKYYVKGFKATDKAGNIGKYDTQFLMIVGDTNTVEKVVDENTVGRLKSKKISASGNGKEFETGANIGDSWYSSYAYDNEELTVTIEAYNSNLKLSKDNFKLVKNTSTSEAEQKTENTKDTADENVDGKVTITCDSAQRSVRGLTGLWKSFWGIADADNYYTLKFIVKASKEKDIYDSYHLEFDKCADEKDVTSYDNAGDIVYIKVDNTAPNTDGTISVNVDTDKKTYSLGSKEANTYFTKNGSITLDISIPSENAVEKSNTIGKNYSGIGRLEYVIVNDNGESQQTLTFKANSDSKDKLSSDRVTITLPESSNGEGPVYLYNLCVYDKAGNKTYINGEKEYDNQNFVIDTVSPTFKFVSVNGNEDINSYFVTDWKSALYYNNDVEGVFEVTDRYLDASKVKLNNVSGFVSPTIINRPEVSFKKDDRGHLFTYKTNGEGEYLFKISANDYSTNSATSDNSPFIIVDKTAPEIKVTYDNGSTFTPNGADKSFSNKDVKVTINVTDKHLLAKDITAVISGKNYKGEDITLKLSESDFSFDENNRIYTAVKTLSADGEYIVKVGAVDLAKNNAKEYAGQSFTIDKTAPKVSIIFDNNNAKNGIYYNSTRVATINVEDYTFTADGASLELTDDGKSSQTDWIKGDGLNFSKTVTFDKDGRYNMSFKAVDKAGNESEKITISDFVVDKTAPTITVTYDNNEAKNGFYFNKKRIASVKIVDDSFSEKDVVVTKMADTSEHKFADMPAMSKFASSDNANIASITFDKDGTYGYKIVATDHAGNVSENYTSDIFVIDTTAPVITFGGVANYSANNGKVAPVVNYAGDNIDMNTSTISINGANNGDVELGNTSAKTPDGYSITYSDFPHEKEYDDLYTMDAHVEDLAGNSADGEIVFSVNRKGSVYVIDADTKEMTDKVYTNNPVDVSITEINVDNLTYKDVSIDKDGDITKLNEFWDYTVNTQGNDKSWKSITYTVKAKNFKDDGRYSVTVYSKDRATNTQDNLSRDKEIEFVVDKTAPSIVTADIKDNGIYREEKHEFSVNVVDNVSVKTLDIYVNGELLKSFEEDELGTDIDTKILELLAKDVYQDVYIVATDEAGNMAEKTIENVYVGFEEDTAKIVDDYTPKSDKADTSKKPGAARVIWLFSILLLIILILIEEYIRRKRKKAKENKDLNCNNKLDTTSSYI